MKSLARSPAGRPRPARLNERLNLPPHRTGCREAEGCQERCFAWLHRALAGDLGQQGPIRRSLAARDQVRRLSPAGADRGGAGEAADPQRARLDGEVRQGSDGGVQGPAGGDRHDRRRTGGREPERRVGLLAAAGRPERRPRRPFRLLRFRSDASRRLRSARDAAGAAQGSLGAAARRRARDRALQRAFRAGRRPDPAACLPVEPGRRDLEAARRRLPVWPRQELGEIQMLPAPGIRGRGLCAVHHLAQGHRLPGARLLR